MAGFGFSIADIAAVGTFAWNLYKSCELLAIQLISASSVAAANVSRQACRSGVSLPHRRWYDTLITVYRGAELTAPIPVGALQSVLHELGDETSNPHSLIHRAGEHQRNELRGS